MKKEIAEILAERERQDRKWGVQRHADLYWMGILMEEVGELSKEIIENKDMVDVKKELVHVAAVAVAWLEDVNHRLESAPPGDKKGGGRH